MDISRVSALYLCLKSKDQKERVISNVQGQKLIMKTNCSSPDLGF